MSLLVSCSEATDVGSGLLGGEDLSIDFREDFNITAQTVASEPVLTYFFPAYTTTQHLIGEVNDPVFGKSKSVINFVPFISGATGPNFSTARYDSLVLSLDIDTTFLYGNINARHDFEVYRVTEEIPNDSLFSDREFQIESTTIGTRNQVRISDLDSINIPVVGVSALVDSTSPEKNLLRIRLNDDLGQTLFDNLNTFSASQELQALIRGVQVRSTTDNGMFAVNLPPGVFTTFRNSLSIYYRDSAENKQIYVMPFGGTAPLHKQFIQDLDSAPIQDVLGVPAAPEDLLYVKGIGGPKVKLDISDAKQLQGTLVNHASIEFFIASNESRDTILYPNASFIAIQKLENGNFEDIVDLSAAKLNGNQISQIFGGDITEDEELKVQKYRMNVTSYVKDLLKDRESGEVFISILNEIQNPQTAILFGPNHPMFPAKLKITYTNP